MCDDGEEEKETWTKGSYLYKPKEAITAIHHPRRQQKYTARQTWQRATGSFRKIRMFQQSAQIKLHSAVPRSQLRSRELRHNSPSAGENLQLLVRIAHGSDVFASAMHFRATLLSARLPSLCLGKGIFHRHHAAVSACDVCTKGLSY